MYRDPFSKIHDVAVFGGGLCGIGTALALSGKGKKIIIVERRPQIGWEITSAFVCEFGEDVSHAAKEIRAALELTGGYKKNLISPPVAEICLSELMKKKNVDVLLYSYPLQLITNKGLACGVVTGSKSGKQVIRARTFVDATEEAVLWEPSGIEFRKTGLKTYRYTIVFNGIKKRIGKYSLPAGKNQVIDIEIKPSVWKGECNVEFKVKEPSISRARLAVPEVISFVRKQVPQLRDAIVTHTAFELFPDDVPQYFAEKKHLRHPKIGNLFCSGMWAIPDTAERKERNSVTGRIATGEETGVLLQKSFNEYRRHTPETPGFVHSSVKDRHTSDVVIAGGGTAGALAAIASARNRVKTSLIESSTMLGGMGTGGGIHAYYHGVAGGLQDEVDERVGRMAPLFCGEYGVHGFHPEAKKVILEQICAEAGVQIFYGTTAIGVEMRAGG